MSKTVEILIYTLKPETGNAFHTIMKDISAPLHAAHGIDIVWHGQSQHSSDSYFLIRSFPDLTALQNTQAAFYSGKAWQNGPRDQIIRMIDKSLKVVVSMTDSSIEAIRENGYGI